MLDPKIFYRYLGIPTQSDDRAAQTRQAVTRRSLDGHAVRLWQAALTVGRLRRPFAGREWSSDV